MKFCQVNPLGPKSVSTPEKPIWSYRLRFSASTRTSYASETSLNFSSAAFGLEALRSGWYWRASFRYALFTSSSVAVRGTPSTS